MYETREVSLTDCLTVSISLSQGIQVNELQMPDKATATVSHRNLPVVTILRTDNLTV